MEPEPRDLANRAAGIGRAARAFVLRLWPKDRSSQKRVLACFALGGVAGYLLIGAKLGDGPATVSDPKPLAAVTLEGKPLALDGDPAKVLDDARGIARAYLAEPIAIAVPGEGKPIELRREQLGASVDPAHLAALLAQARDPKSAMRREHAHAKASGAGKRGNDARAAAGALALALPVGIDGKRALAALVALKDDVDRPPMNARLDLGAKKVIPDEPGRRLDVHATLARIEVALAAREPKAEAVTEAIAAKRTAAQIADVQWGDVIGYFETKYARDKKHEARTYNLRLAASKLDGHVLMPGEIFDFNDIVGPRNEANGYKIAPVIAQGELVDGIGGGTCQIAGTLHGAAFFGGLDIVERRPHTRPSFYIKMGMDAAVAYPAITLRLRNPFPYPVVLRETVQGGMVRAEVLGPKRSRDVTFVRKVNEVIPFQEKEIPDAKVPKGERVLSQRGIPGFKITRYRLLRDGSFAVRERMLDAYPPTTQIWKVGTGDDDPKWEARDDEHPEYIADEYLSISQGPSIIVPKTGQPSTDPGGAMVESRVAGRYGARGWTIKEGFAKEPPRRTRGRKSASPNDPTEDDARPD